MDIKQILLQDENFVKVALTELVKEEIKRVVNLKLISTADLKDLVEKCTIPELYTKLSNIKISNDYLKEDKQEVNEIKLEEVSETTKPITKIEKLVIDELEKIAYNIGKNGDHETAYIVEKTIKEIEKM